MKDNLSLIAAAAGGFMLSIAASSIIHAAPVISLNSPSTLTPATIQTSAPSAPLRFGKTEKQKHA